MDMFFEHSYSLLPLSRPQEMCNTMYALYKINVVPTKRWLDRWVWLAIWMHVVPACALMQQLELPFSY